MENTKMIEESIAKIIDSGYSRIRQLESILGCEKRGCVVCNGSDCPAIKK